MTRHAGTPPRAPLLAAAGALAGGLAGFWVWLGYTYGEGNPVAFLLAVTVACCFVTAGLVAWRLRPRSRTGPWMLAFGLVMLLAEPNNSDIRLATHMPGRELVVLLGVPADWLQYAVGAHLLLAYPTGRLPGRLERRIVSLGFLASGVGAALLLLTKTPVPAVCGSWCGRSPVQLIDNIALYLGIRSALILAWIALGAAIVALLVRRALRSTPRQRRVLGLMLIAAGVMIVLAVASHLNVLALYLGRSDPAAAEALGLAAQVAAVVALPLAFLVGLLRERLAFAAVGVLVARLEHVRPDAVEAELGRTLNDPTLRVAFPTASGWLDVAGRPYDPDARPTQALMPLGDPPTAVLAYDPSVADQRELLEAAGAAARLALENARLHAEVRAQLAEVRASRQRIAAAADAERQRLERDLHDGAQQRLLGVGLTLGVLRGRLDGDDRALVDELERDLRAAIGELRELAQGIRPAVLTDQGLVPALARLARRAGLRVALTAHVADRLDPVVEATAYYVVSEALQNITKHAGGAAAQVRATHETGCLIVDVSDDGPGGASIVAGTGLRGLADRVEAIGGRFGIHSPPGGGTHIRAELPCV